MADPIPLRRSPPYGLGAPFDPAAPPGPLPEQGDQVVHLEEGGDGSVDVVITDQPPEEEQSRDDSFDENLAERDELKGALATIAIDLLDGIAADESSREDWVQNYNAGLDLLGLKITGKSAIGSETMSSVTHPILLEACLRMRALARGEMLPAAGPVKVRNDGDETDERQQLADQLESDVNHYLTVTASEYYPDTDRGLIYLAFGGDIFKKVYHDPVRKRPVSECVYLPDLIVSQDATDLQNATRVTHRIDMSRLQVQRLMKASAYIEVELSSPAVNPPAIERKEKELQGIAAVPRRQEDYTRVIYECYTDLDLSGSLTEPDAPEDLPLPYRVTLDKDSRQVLEVRRNWRKDDDRFRRRQRFVKWPFMPGMGFYDLGYLHIIGQHAKALTALWRIMIDAGMFANFPGGVKLKGSRTATNQIRPAPGEWVEIDGGAAVNDIRQILMPMPYKEVSATLLQLAGTIEDDARKLAGTVDLEAGEGRTNVPVGTIMAMIEQQTQMMTAVHKGLHQAQQEEFILLRELFAEDPESLWRENLQPTHKWKADELKDLSLVPASDPNIPAHIHRTMQGYALAMLSANNPLYDQMAVQKRLLETLHISDPDTLLVSPEQLSSAPGAGDGAAQSGTLPPAALAAIAQKQLDTQAGKAQADAADAAKRTALTEQKDRETAALAAERDKTNAALTAQKNQLDHAAKMEDIRQRWSVQMKTLESSAADRDSREAIAAMNGQVQLILKGIEQLGQPTSPDPAHDTKAGP